MVTASCVGPKSFTSSRCRELQTFSLNLEFHRVLQARNEVLEELPWARQALIRARVSSCAECCPLPKQGCKLVSAVCAFNRWGQVDSQNIALFQSAIAQQHLLTATLRDWQHRVLEMCLAALECAQYGAPNFLFGAKCKPPLL